MMSTKDENNEEILACSTVGQDTLFDITIGHIEDIIIDGKFEKLQGDFMIKYCQEFEDTEENKLEYTTIFLEYQELIEKHLEKKLTEQMPNFSMQDFIKQLTERRKELEGEVFEMLLSFSDFLVFKELMLDFKNEKEGKCLDLSDGFVVTSLAELHISK